MIQPHEVKIEDMELEMSPMAETFEQVKATLRRHFEVKDWQAVELILAAAIAHYAPGEMLWFRIIGPSRSGKTELLRAISQHSDCAKMEHLTPAALRGGFKKGAKLLQRIDGKLVVTKDLATLLTTRKDARNEIFGLLRPIKDGELVSDFGSDEGHLQQSFRFDWIVATTQAFEQSRQLESLLGEHFIDMRWRPGDREQMAYLAGLNNPFLRTVIRPELAADVCSLLARASTDMVDVELADSEIKTISQYADKTARLRTPVQRDRFRNLVAYPEPEIGTDLTQGFSRIVKGLKLLDVDYETYLNRLLWDCMPTIRARVLECLARGENDPNMIASLTNLSRSTVHYLLEDLRLLGLIDANNNLFMQLHII
jgi:hypothetical protein